jgi:hypothetical protein
MSIQLRDTRRHNILYVGIYSIFQKKKPALKKGFGMDNWFIAYS